MFQITSTRRNNDWLARIYLLLYYYLGCVVGHPKRAFRPSDHCSTIIYATTMYEAYRARFSVARYAIVDFRKRRHPPDVTGVIGVLRFSLLTRDLGIHNGGVGQKVRVLFVRIYAVHYTLTYYNCHL